MSNTENTHIDIFVFPFLFFYEHGKPLSVDSGFSHVKGVEGMAKDWAKPFYNSKAWKKCRASYIKQRTLIDGGMCEICHEEPIYIVHHKVTLTPANINDPDIALNHCLIEGNCKRCHDRQEGHFIDSLNIPKLNCSFDESGNPVDLRKV